MSGLLVTYTDPKFWQREVSMQIRNNHFKGMIYRHKEDPMLWKWNNIVVRAHSLNAALPLFLEQAENEPWQLKDWEPFGDSLLVIKGYKGRLYKSATTPTCWKWKGISFKAKDYGAAVHYLLENVSV